MDNWNQITCIAIDDEPRALRLIESYCNQVSSVKLLGAFNNPIEAFNYLKHNIPDVIFIDIRMPDITGIQLVKSLEKKPNIIFTTAYSEYAVESYELEALDYLLKPFDFDRFKQAIDKVFKQKNREKSSNTEKSKEETIHVMIEYKKVPIKLKDILYIESMDNYIKIYTIYTCHIVLRSLKSIYEELPQDKFMQVHKSFVVSLSKIDFYKRNQIFIQKKTIPIGRVYIKQFKENILK